MNTQGLMKSAWIALAVAGLSLAATGAYADGNRYGNGYGNPNGHMLHGGSGHSPGKAYSQTIHARQYRQTERIQTGFRSGQLTRSEFHGLMHEQRRIRFMAHHARADGRIDAREYRRLDRTLDVASRHIAAEKHDRQERHVYRHNSRFD